MYLPLLRKKSGFTLIELIVVIAILGLLAGIGAPLIMAHLKSAQITKCTANMKQLAQLGNQYSQDMINSNTLPTSGMDDNEETEEMNESEAWWMSIAPQMDSVVLPGKQRKMKISSIFHCPGDTRHDIGSDDLFTANEKSVSYVSWTDASSDPENPNSEIRIVKQRLDELPWLSDGIPVNGQSVKNIEDFRRMVLPSAERHASSIVVAYASGRVAAIELDLDEPDIYSQYKKVAPWLAEKQGNETKKKKRNRRQRD